MGLAFSAISATPFWQALISSKQLAAPEMVFQLTRFRGTNFQEEEPGVVNPGRDQLVALPGRY
jgi:hypothetical protein